MRTLITILVLVALVNAQTPRCCCIGPLGGPCVEQVASDLCVKAGGSCATEAPTSSPAPTKRPTPAPTTKQPTPIPTTKQPTPMVPTATPRPSAPPSPLPSRCCCNGPSNPQGPCTPRVPSVLCVKAGGECQLAPPSSAAPTGLAPTAPTAPPPTPLLDVCCCVPNGGGPCVDGILRTLCEKGGERCQADITPAPTPPLDLCCCVPLGQSVCVPDILRSLCRKGMGQCTDEVTESPTTPPPTPAPTAADCCCYPAGADLLTGSCTPNTPSISCTKGGGTCSVPRCCCIFDVGRPGDCQLNFPQDMCLLSGYSCAAVIGGYAFEDLNQDGSREFGERFLEGVQVRITDSAGSARVVSTALDGTFSAKVPPGSTQVAWTTPSGFTITTAATQTYDVPAGGSAQSLGGFFDQTTPGTISGIVFLDLNADGTQQPAEPAIANAELYVTTSAGNVIQVITNADGFWLQQVPPGDTRIVAQPQSFNAPGYAVTVGGLDVTTNVPPGGSLDQIILGITQGPPCCCLASGAPAGTSCVPDVPTNACTKVGGSCVAQPTCCCHAGGSPTCIAGVDVATCLADPLGSCQAPPTQAPSTCCCQADSAPVGASCIANVSVSQCTGTSGFSCTTAGATVPPACCCQPTNGTGCVPDVQQHQCTVNGQGQCIAQQTMMATVTPPTTCCCYSGSNPNCVANVVAQQCTGAGGSCTQFTGTLIPGFSYAYSQIAAGGCVGPAPGSGSISYADVNLFINRAVGEPLATISGNIQFTPFSTESRVTMVRLMQQSSGFPVSLIWIGTGKPSPFVFSAIQLPSDISEDIRVNPNNYYVRIDTDQVVFPNGEMQTQLLGDPAPCP